MAIAAKDLEDIIAFITAETGIIPRESHKVGIASYLEEVLESLQKGVKVSAAVNCSAFLKDYFLHDRNAMVALINKATVNETYFFREEKQFDLLKNVIFPELLKTSRWLNIWSAAASSGEEIYSLALLAHSLNIRADYTASDINTIVLQKLKNGIFGANSIRSMDGAKYHYLLEPYKTKDGTYRLSPELVGSVITKVMNLADLAKDVIPESLPRHQHVIFIRNVFIYFSLEMRAKILSALAKHCLAPGGCIFVSMSEIASIENRIIPPELERVMSENVFYFHKKA